MDLRGNVDEINKKLWLNPDFGDTYGGQMDTMGREEIFEFDLSETEIDEGGGRNS